MLSSVLSVKQKNCIPLYIYFYNRYFNILRIVILFKTLSKLPVDPQSEVKKNAKTDENL